MKTKSILSIIYPEQEIFIKKFSFSKNELSIKITCEVPIQSYVKNSIPYITAENYVRCISQASYLLAYHVLKNKLISTKINEISFLKEMENYELYYRNMSMTFHKKQKRGEKFEMELTLKSFNEIKDFILFTFSIKRNCISGEMSFIFNK